MRFNRFIPFCAAVLFLSAVACIVAKATETTLVDAQLRGLLEAREVLWRSWFSNDQKALEAVLPERTVAINAGQKEWENRDDVLASARKFAADGGRLIRLEFSRVEHQAFGDVVVLYSEYLFETETSGERTVTSGRATEVFVRENGRWVNPGWHMDSGS